MGLCTGGVQLRAADVDSRRDIGGGRVERGGGAFELPPMAAAGSAAAGIATAGVTASGTAAAAAHTAAGTGTAAA